MAKYHPPKKPRQYKTIAKNRLRPAVGFFKKRKLLTAVIAAFFIAITIGMAFWLISPNSKKSPAKKVENANPFDNLPGASEIETQIKESSTVGKDRKLLELTTGFNYLYENNYQKAETIGRQYIDDPEVKQKAQCLLALIYQRGNVQSLKPFEELCKE